MRTANLPGLTVRFRGVRGSTPCAGRATVAYGGNTSCVEVRSGDALLILDAGTGLRNLGNDLMRAHGDRPIEADLLISHTHWDHIQGLPFFAPAYVPRNRIRILAPNTRRDAVECALRTQMAPLHFPVGFDEMRGIAGIEELAGDQLKVGNFSVGVIGLNHPGGCAGFRIEAGGASVAYLPDHEPYAAEAGEANDSLVEFIRGVDLLILDTQYTEAEYSKRVGWGHGSLPRSVALAVEAEVRRFALFHHDPSHEDPHIDEMVVEARARAAASPLLVLGAAENETIHLPARPVLAVPAETTVCAVKSAVA